jgi:sulfite reductase alpha subunit-like flavoprotein
LDIFGRPSRRFYEFLALAAKDESEKKAINNLLSKEGKPELLGLIKETATYADLLEKFPSSVPSLDYLI